jgi:hypothetical protein
MKYIVRFRLTFALLCLLGLPCVSAAQEEFVGPFPSWADVKRDFGAVGDGKADDTAAIQRALDALRDHKRFCVLFFPAGTYRITNTIRTERKAHTDCMVSVIGEAPETTVIKWDGLNGTIIQFDAWYAKLSRLTLDGAGKAVVGVGYGDAFSTYNETSDLVIKDVVYGIWLGTGQGGQAENSVLRCKFIRCSDSGIKTYNFNSMDIWVWYCLFEDCGYGLFNGSGNFHVYQSLFLGSRKMDIGINNLMVFAIVNNTSIGSKCFLNWRSGMSWGSPTSITGNRIIDPADVVAITLGNGGPYLLMDNVIKGRSATKRPQIEMTWGDQTFLGNTYTSTDPRKPAGRYRWLDEKTVDPGTIDGGKPLLPGAPLRQKRRIIEIEPGSRAGRIQLAIDEAATLKGKRPVIHFPMGTFQIDRTLEIPAECDVQIVGDGAAEVASVLRWTGRAGHALFHLAGPAKATLEDLHIAAGSGIGITVDDCDQPGGKIFTDQLNVSGMSNHDRASTGVWADRIDDSDVLLRCFQGGSSIGQWIKVTGGEKRQANGGAGQTAVLCGATASSNAPYTVEKNGRLVVRTVYHELDESEDQAPTAIKLDASGSLVVDTTRYSYRTSSKVPLIDCQGFRGTFALTSSLFMPVNSLYPGTIAFRGEGSRCDALCLDCLFWSLDRPTNSNTVWKNEARPPATAAFLNCNQNGNSKDGKGFFEMLAERNAPNNDDLMRRTLAPLRSTRVWFPANVSDGITTLGLHRIMIRAGKDGVGVILHGKRI